MVMWVRRNEEFTIPRSSSRRKRSASRSYRWGTNSTVYLDPCSGVYELKCIAEDPWGKTGVCIVIVSSS